MASLFPPEEVVPSAVDTLPEYDKSFEFDIPLLSTVDDIADALKKFPEGILDKPEQFVLMMAMIGNLDERLKVSNIESKICLK